MREFKQCIEREKIVFNVEVKDPNAPVEFFKNGEKIVPDGERVEIVNLGQGRHQVSVICTVYPVNSGIFSKKYLITLQFVELGSYRKITVVLFP